MFALKRNQVIITALVVMIAVAGYLNYVDSNKTAQQVASADSSETDALVPDYTTTGDISDAAYDDTTVSDVSGADTMTSDSSADQNQITYSDGSTAETYDSNDTQAVASTDDNVAAAPDTSTNNSSEAVFVNTTPESSYFVQAKLDREQSRSETEDELQTIVNDSNTPSEQKAEASDELLQLQQWSEEESACEAMIEAKGFDGAYVRIDDNTADVVVEADALTDAQVAQIEDIVTRKTGMDYDQVRISTME